MSSALSVTAAQAPAATRQQWATRILFLVIGALLAAWAAIVPFAQDRLGLDAGGLGALLLCLGIGSIVAMPVTGVLASRYGCRIVLIVGTLVAAAALPVLALAGDVVTMALALAIFGGAVGTLDVTVNIQAVMVEKDSGRPMMSGFHGLFSLGGVLGAGGASALLQVGATPATSALCFALFALAALAVCVRGLLPFGHAGEGAAMPFVLPRGFVAFVGGLCFLMFLTEGVMLDWGAVFLVSTRGVTPAAAGYGFAAFAVAMTVCRLAGDRIVALFGPVKVVAFGGLLAAAGLALQALVPGAAAAFAGFVLVGVGASNVVPVLFSSAGRRTDMPQGLAIAAVTTLGYVGVLAGPALVGLVAHFTSLTTAFALLALAMLFVAASSRVARR